MTGGDALGAEIIFGLNDANPEIFSVRAYRFDNLNKGLSDLRDRRVLAFAESDVKELRLERGDERIILTRQEGDAWQLQADVAVSADKDAVDGLVRAVQTGKLKEFTDEAPDSTILSQRSLAPTPLVDLALVVGSDRAEKRLQVGHLSRDGHYARDLSRNVVFTIDTTLVAKLYQSVHDLRDKEPVQFDQESITQIELHRAAETVVAQKDTAGQWIFVQPAQRQARSWKLSGLLGDLNGVEVEGFIDDQAEDLAPYRLDPALVTVRLLAGGEEAVEVRLAEADGDQTFLYVGGIPSVYLVSGEVLQNVNLSLEDLAQPLPAADEGAGADGE